MADIANFPSRKKSRGFLSSMTASARTATPASRVDEPEPTVNDTPTMREPVPKAAPTHNTTINLTLEQRAWLRWREVVTKQSMGDLVREAIEEQMQRMPMPPEVEALFR